jgi:hypothetical protein
VRDEASHSAAAISGTGIFSPVLERSQVSSRIASAICDRVCANGRCLVIEGDPPLRSAAWRRDSRVT